MCGFPTLRHTERIVPIMEQRTETRPDGFKRTQPRSMDGESFTVWKVFPPVLTDEEIAELFEQAGFDVEERRCTHSYDCCGQFYSDGLWTRRTETRTLAYVGWHQNV